MKIYIRADIVDPMDESKEAQLELIRSGRMRPETFLRFAKSKYADVRAAVAGSLDTPVNVLAKLAKDRTITVRKAVAENPNTPREALLKLLQDSDHDIYYEVSNNKHFTDTLTAEELDMLSYAETKKSSWNWGLKEFVAAHPNTSADTLIRLAQLRNSRLAGVAIRNPNMPIEQLSEFSNAEPNVDPYSGRVRIDDNWSKLKAVAENPNTTPEILTKLGLGDYEFAIHAEVASNKNTPPEVLAKLSKDTRGSSTRSNVARNPNTPVDILEELADDQDWIVRSSLVSNENLPEKLLEYLATDSDHNVRGAVARNPRTSEATLRKLAEDDDNIVLFNLAENPNLPEDLIERLSRHSSGFVRDYIARNLSTPPEILARLAQDYDPYADIKGSVAKNPNTPLDVLEALIHNNHYDDVAQNPKATHEMLLEAYDEAQSYEKKVMRKYLYAHPNFRGFQ